MRADDYQRDYEAMMAWAHPHRHSWLLLQSRGIEKCADCVEERRAPLSQFAYIDCSDYSWMHD